MTNKELLIRFYDEVFNKHDLSNLGELMRDDYRQHNPDVKDGKAGFIEFCTKFITQDPHTEIRHLIAEDDLVCVFFKCTFKNGSAAKVADIYRVQDGKLAEHWDVVSGYNESELKPQNSNGLF
jgi:predicted SnoaL-like aldol condensation-catalyzing enzyme